ncbi:MAG: hypothetical protein ACN2B6_12175 [Rickettsiales bacterium]
MAAILFFNPKPGTDFAAGDKLYFYTTATTTDLTVYQDSALSTPHAQPVVADADGVFAPIYIDATGDTPRVKLFSSADVEKWDVDPVPISDLTALTASVATNTADIATLEGQMTTAEAEIDALQVESSDYETRITALEGESVSTAFSETVLYDNLSAPTSGSLTLSESYKNFDALLCLTTNGGGSQLTPNFYTKTVLGTGGSFSAVSGRGAVSNAHIGFTVSSNTEFTVSGSSESTRIVRIIGMVFSTLS